MSLCNLEIFCRGLYCRTCTLSKAFAEGVFRIESLFGSNTAECIILSAGKYIRNMILKPTWKQKQHIPQIKHFLINFQNLFYNTKISEIHKWCNKLITLFLDCLQFHQRSSLSSPPPRVSLSLNPSVPWWKGPNWSFPAAQKEGCRPLKFSGTLTTPS